MVEVELAVVVLVEPQEVEEGWLGRVQAPGAVQQGVEAAAMARLEAGVQEEAAMVVEEQGEVVMVVAARVEAGGRVAEQSEALKYSCPDREEGSPSGCTQAAPAA